MLNINNPSSKLFKSFQKYSQGNQTITYSDLEELIK